MEKINELSYKDLKKIADGMGIQYLFNIKKVVLKELITKKQEQLLREAEEVKEELTTDEFAEAILDNPIEEVKVELTKKEQAIKDTKEFFIKLQGRKAGTSTEIDRMTNWYNIIFDKNLAPCYYCSSVINTIYNSLRKV